MNLFSEFSSFCSKGQHPKYWNFLNYQWRLRRGRYKGLPINEHLCLRQVLHILNGWSASTLCGTPHQHQFLRTKHHRHFFLLTFGASPCRRHRISGEKNTLQQVNCNKKNEASRLKVCLKIWIKAVCWSGLRTCVIPPQDLAEKLVSSWLKIQVTSVLSISGFFVHSKYS